ncbi:MAG: hypothetical protein H6Q34_1002 [Deltaproteobacteria bacterium]|nr:hypothetical protein [Deltaproteobacteria bacterium]
MRLKDEGERLQDERVTRAPHVEHGAIGLGDAREEPEDDVTASEVGLQAALLIGPAVAERPHVGVGGIVSATVTQPRKGPVEELVVTEVGEGQGRSRRR